MSSLSDRDPRKMLSKSFMVGADLCGMRAWRDVHYPRPFVMTEQVAFGKAVDFGVQFLIAQPETPPEPDLATDWGLALMKEDRRLVDRLAVLQALELFVPLMSSFDFRGCLVQAHLRRDIEGIGTIDCHPDIILADGTILDIKTSAKAKSEDAAAESVLELGFYALARYYETGDLPPRVGYVTYVRTKSPWWQTILAPVNERFIERAAVRAGGYRGALDADAAANEGVTEPRNVSFPNGPKYAGMCNTCAHAPRNGGACTITAEE